MSKYFNPRLLNAVIAGTGMRNPVRPHVILGSEDGEFVRGDLMDANAIQEFINQKISDLVNNAPEALDTLKELADAIQENGVADLVTKGQLEAALNTKVDEEDLLDYVKKSDMSTMDANGHDYVEIGGVKWATMNVGANSVTDIGLYFQWGDTQGYTASQVGTDKVFNWANYKYSDNGTTTMTKYNGSDHLTTLEPSDDAAIAAWGGNWRIPTKEEFDALRAATTSAWTADYEGSGVAGLVLTSTADSSMKLFFPACGYCYNNKILNAGSFGYCWINSLTNDVTNGKYLSFKDGTVYWTGGATRYCGCPIRGVLDGVDKYATKAEVEQLQSNIVQSDWNQNDTNAVDYIKNKPDVALKSDVYTTVIDNNGHEYVDLGLPSGVLWATMNIGAASETGFGNHYLYGRGASIVQETYLQNSYTGSEDPLDLSKDTARQVWGGNWRMPTKNEYSELLSNTTYQWVTDYLGSGVNGATFTAQNGNMLFIPAAGDYTNDQINGENTYALLWTSTPAYNASGAWYFYSKDNKKFTKDAVTRVAGYSVRAVIESSVVPKFTTSTALSTLEARVAALEAYHTT